MNKLTTTDNRTLSSQGPDNPLADLPRWLGYLASAYPSSKLSDEAFLVMEDQFIEFGPAVLLAAAREFVRGDKRAFKNTPGGFPTASELRPVVERVKAQDDETKAERAAAAHLDWFDACQVLRVRRLELLEAWYNDAVSDHQLSRFADEMQAAGLESAAANLRGRL